MLIRAEKQREIRVFKNCFSTKNTALVIADFVRKKTACTIKKYGAVIDFL